MLFSEEAELINRCDGLAAFHSHERDHAGIPLPDGPFAKFIRTIAGMQGASPKESPFRIGLVTARNYPAHERAIRTLRAWNVGLDGGAFLGGLPKDGWLRAFQPHIFFDDQEVYCLPAARCVPTAQVPYPLFSPPVQTELVALADGDERRAKFLLMCRAYLKQGAKRHGELLHQWYTTNLGPCSEAVATAFLAELEESVRSTPVGRERPGRGKQDLSKDKFLAFLDALLHKYRPGE